MLRLALLLALYTHSTPAYVTNTPTFAMTLDRLHKLHEKLEQVNSPTTQPPQVVTENKLQTNWQKKLDEFNAINMDSVFLTQEDEDLLKMTQAWGKLTPEQMDGMAKELMRTREEKDDRSYSVERLALDQDLQSEYDDLYEYPSDGDYPDYRNDEEVEPSSEPPFRVPPGVTPSAFTREDSPQRDLVSAAEAMALTNERPQVIEETSLTPSVRHSLMQEIHANIRYVMKNSICQSPQPRWLSVRQLAPAADIIYLPPWVRLHRCSPDSGCCNSDSEICAPTKGSFVTLPFYLNKPTNNMSLSHIVFYNHTSCECVSRDTLRTVKARRNRYGDERRTEINGNTGRVQREERILQERRAEQERTVGQEERVQQEERVHQEGKVEQDERVEHDGRIKKEKTVEQEERTQLQERKVEQDRVDQERRIELGEERKEERQNDHPTVAPAEEDVTSPPLMRRCTCPAHFMASLPPTGACSCVCEWSEPTRRRTCLSFSKGEEHFGLRDRVCVQHGDCTPPTCKYGAYDTRVGKCPLRKYRRLRYHHARRYQPEKAVVV